MKKMKMNSSELHHAGAKAARSLGVEKEYHRALKKKR
jgi:hypothetical protein